MEPFVAVVADYQLYIVVVVVFVADLAGHVLESFVPLLSGNVGGSESEIAFALFGATQALGEGGTIDIKLVVKSKFLIVLNISKRKYPHTNLTEHIPLLRDAVRLAGVVDKSGDVAFVGGVDDLTF